MYSSLYRAFLCKPSPPALVPVTLWKPDLTSSFFTPKLGVWIQWQLILATGAQHSGPCERLRIIQKLASLPIIEFSFIYPMSSSKQVPSKYFFSKLSE